MKTYLIPIFLLFTGCKGCDDTPNPEPTLPPVTTTGANTFGCKVNGKLWLPSKRSIGTLPKIEGGIVTRYVGGGREKNWYDILIFANNNDGSGFQINLSRINSPGVYPLNFTNCVFAACIQMPSYGYYYENENRFSAITIEESKVVLIRYDTINKIFSGTFSFKAKAFYGIRKDTIDVTDGRFDIDQKKIN